jgi:hypothetical protein
VLCGLAGKVCTYSYFDGRLKSGVSYRSLRSLSLINGRSTEDIKERRRLNNSAHQKLSTTNPVIKPPAIRIIRAFITKRKRPKVRMVTGRVRITRMGFMIILRIASTNASTIAVQKLLIWMPGRKLVIPYATAAVMIRRMMKFMMVVFSFQLSAC